MRENGTVTSLLLTAAFALGLSLVLYPSVSNYINSINSTREIASYAEEVAGLDEELCEKLWGEAEEYNRTLLRRGNAYVQTDRQKKLYGKLLNINATGAMGYIEIPSLSVTLPVYHGTSDAVLQRAVGHIEWTSLPVGGEGTHSVLSGHRGLPSSKLFTELDKLIAGDIFMLRVLNRTLTYEVDKILIVEPADVLSLSVSEKKDYCTLVTCTPYGINTHRLLVRGHRIENREESIHAALISEAVQIEPLAVAPILAVPLLLMTVIFTLFPGRGRRSKP